jgi:hypothetical protein
MPRCFFNISDGTLSFVDEKGKELSDLQEAHLHALAILEKMLRLIPDYITASCKINITLSNREPLLTVIHPSLVFAKETQKKAG